MEFRKFQLFIIVLVVGHVASSNIFLPNKFIRLFPDRQIATKIDVKEKSSPVIATSEKETSNRTDLLKNPFVNFLVKKLEENGIGDLLLHSQNDTSKLTANINYLFGMNILAINGSHIQINYVKVLDLIKVIGGQAVERKFGKNRILTRLAQRILNNTIDEYFSKFKSTIITKTFPLGDKNHTFDTTSKPLKKNEILLNIALDLLTFTLRPLQPLLNQTLLTVTDILSAFYEPILPSEKTQSMVTSTINQAISKSIEVIDMIRKLLNSLLATQHELKSKPKYISRKNDLGNTTKTPINIILGPVKFLLRIFLSPLHDILMNLAFFLFTAMRPIVGGIILRPIENIVMSIIDLIPCSC